MKKKRTVNKTRPKPKPRIKHKPRIKREPRKLKIFGIIEKLPIIEKLRARKKARITEKPPVIKKPRITEKPKAIKKPRVTEKPPVIKKPRVTEKPRVIKKNKIIKKPIEYIEKYKEIILYLVFGGLTTVLNFALLALFHYIIGFSEGLANAIAWVLSLIYAYIVNRIFVFESKAKGFTGFAYEFGSFFSARAFSGAVDIFVIWFFVQKLSLNLFIFKTATQIFTIVFNYAASKLFIFKEKKQ